MLELFNSVSPARHKPTTTKQLNNSNLSFSPNLSTNNMLVKSDPVQTVVGDDWGSLKRFNEAETSTLATKTSNPRPWNNTPKPLSSIPAWFNRYYSVSNLVLNNPVMLVAMDTSDFRAWSKSVEPTTIVKANLKNPNNTKDCFLLPLSVKGI